MQMNSDMRQQHQRALRDADEMIARHRAEDLTRGTPCAGWDLGVLLAHMIGQNDGFAQAASTGDALKSAYAPPMIGPDDVMDTWSRSVDRVLTAFAEADLERPVRLVEINPVDTFPAAAVVAFHLLDTVIHTWDVATSLDQPYRPDEDLVTLVAGLAQLVPGGAARTRPEAAFAPAITTSESDPWLRTLATLGRSQPG